MKGNLLRIFISVFICLNAGIIFAQNVDDYRSKASGNWHDPSIWEKYNGSTWESAIEYPTQANGTITIRSGHTVTLYSPVIIDQTVVEPGGSLILSGSTLTINDGTDIDLEIYGNLQHNSGSSIAGSGQVRINSGSSTMDWNGGTINSLNLTVNGILNIATTNEKNLNNATITNSGTINWYGGNIRGGNSTFSNSGYNSQFNIQCNASFEATNGALTLQNNGTINKTSAGTTSFKNGGILNNSGTVNVQSGTLDLASGGTQSGSFVISSGATLSFSNGMHQLNSTIFSGNGTIQISGATVNASNASFQSGTTLNLASGTLGGTSATISGTMNWTGGTITSLSLNVTGQLNISGASDKFIINNARLTNQGTITWSGTGSIKGGLGATIDNNTTFNIQSDTLFTAESGGALTLQNNGTINKTSAGTTSFKNGGILNNSGTINVRSGTLDLASGGTQSGSFVISSGATLSFSNGMHQLNSTIFSGNGTIQISGATVNASNASFQSGTTLNLAVGTLSGTSATINGTMNWTGGNISSISSLTIGTTGTLNIGGSNDKGFNGTLYNNGNIIISGTGGLIASLVSVIENRSSGVIDIQNDASFSQLDTNYCFMINNAGTLKKTNGTGTANFNTKVELHNDGVVQVEKGTINLSGGGTNNGTISVSSGAVLAFGGAYSMSSSSSVSGSGTINFNYNTISIGGRYRFDGIMNINGGAVEFNSSDTVGTINIVGGHLSGNGVVTIFGGTWTVGNLMNSGTLIVARGATFTINGDSQKSILYGRVLNNMGTIDWKGGNIFCSDISIINSIEANFNIKTDATIINSSTNNFLNYGLITKENSNGETVINIPFYNDSVASVIVSTGILRFACNGTYKGNFTINSNSRIEMDVGISSISLVLGSNISGSGTFAVRGGKTNITGRGTYSVKTTEITGGSLQFALENNVVLTNVISNGGSTTFKNSASIQNLTVNGSVTFDSTFSITNLSINNSNGSFISTCNGDTARITNFTINAGLASFNSPVAISSLTLRNGTLSSNGNVLISGLFNWESGTLSGIGDIDILTGATGTFTQGTKHLQGRNLILENGASVTWIDGNIELADGATIEIGSGASFYGQAQADINGASSGTIINNGVYNHSSNITHFGIPIINNNILNIKSGSLIVENGGTYRGVISVAKGAYIHLSSGDHNFEDGSTITDSGTVYLYGGTALINGYSQGVTISGGARLNNCGRLRGAGKLIINDGFLDWNTNDTLTVSTCINHGNISMESANMILSEATTVYNYGKFFCGTGIVEGSGNFIMEDNSTLGIGHKDGISSSNLLGNLQNTGTRYINPNGNFIYYGGVAQVTGDGLPSIVNGLVIDKISNHVVLSKNTIVSSSLILNAGAIETDTNIITLGTSSSNIGSLTYISGSIMGNFRRWIPATAINNVLFPLGVEETCMPVNISFTSAPTSGGTITATFIQEDPGNKGCPLNDDGVSVVNVGQNGYWRLVTDDGLSGGIYNIDLTATGFYGINNYKLLRILKRSNSESPWVLNGSHVDCTGSNEVPTAHRIGLTGFSEFGIGSPAENPLRFGNPLPILSRITPTSASRKQKLGVHFEGANFINGVSSVNVGDGIKIDSVTFVDSTNLIAYITALPDTGTRFFSVTNNPPGGGKSDSIAFCIFNNPPNAVNLLSPENGDTIELVTPGKPIVFGWTKSIDPDPADTIEYSLNIKGASFDTTIHGIKDTSISIDIMDLLEPDLYSWTVNVTDGIFTVASQDTFKFYITPPTSVVSSDINNPREFKLYQNYPNPFNPVTRITFTLPEKSPVTLKIYDALGREVAVLVSGELPAGRYTEVWDARNFPSGVYFYRLQAGKFSQTKKLLLVK